MSSRSTVAVVASSRGSVARHPVHVPRRDGGERRAPPAAAGRSSAAARNGERALPPGTVVSTRSCDEAMGAVSRSSGAGRMPWPRLPGSAPLPARRPVGGRRARPSASCQPDRRMYRLEHDRRDPREHRPVDRLWSTISDVRHWPQWLPTVDAVTPLDPDRPDEVGASLHGRAARPAQGRLDDHRLGGGPLVHLGVGPARHPSVGTHTLTAGRRRQHHHRARDHLVGAAGTAVRLPLGRKSLDYVTREAAALDATAGGRADARRGA